MSYLWLLLLSFLKHFGGVNISEKSCMHSDVKPGRLWPTRKLSLQKFLTANCCLKTHGEFICNISSVRITKGKMENGIEFKN